MSSHLDEESVGRELPKVFMKDKRNEKSNELKYSHLIEQKDVFGHIARRLEQLGYSTKQIHSLITNCPEVQSLEQAVDFLVKDANGWQHPFIQPLSAGIFHIKKC